MRYATGALLALAGRLGALVFGGAVAIALARWLGPAARGEFALVTLIPGLLVALAGLGVGQAEVVLVSRAPERFGSGVANALLFSAVASVCAAALTIAVAPLLGAAVPVLANAVSLAVIVASLPPLLFYSLVHQLLQARRAFAWSAALLVVAYVLFLGALAIFVGWLDLGLAGALGAWLSSHIVLALTGLYALARTGRLERPDLVLLRAELAFGLPSWAASLALYVATRAPLFLAGAFLSAGNVGLLSVAITLAELLWYGAESAAVALGPLVARSAHAEGAVPTPYVVRVVLLATTIGAVTLGVLGEPLLSLLFGHEFVAAAAALRWLLPGIVALSVAKVVASDLYGRGRPGTVLLGFALACLVSTGAALVTIPSAGIVGASLAYTVAYLSCTVLFVALYVRVTGTRVRDVVVPRPRDLVVAWDQRRGLFARSGSRPPQDERQRPHDENDVAAQRSPSDVLEVDR